MTVTLTTDFGLADGYVAAMKGAVLGYAPEARLVDVTHAVAPQDVMGAAFVLAQATPFLPDGAVHLVVVDPGVGTARRAIAARVQRACGGTFVYVGPDNGILSLLLADPGGGGTLVEAVVLDRPEAWRTGAPTATFHGRDVFGPVAGRIAAGARLGTVGSAIGALQPLHWPLPITDADGIDGMVLHVDRFGNCLTNIARAAVDETRHGRQMTCYAGSAIVHGLAATYGSVAGGEPAVLFGSGGFLEVAVNGGNAAELLSICRGTTVTLLFDDAAARRPRARAIHTPA